MGRLTRNAMPGIGRVRVAQLATGSGTGLELFQPADLRMIEIYSHPFRP